MAHKFREIHQYTGILDFERGREDRLVPYPWLTDTVLADWFNNKATPYRPLGHMIRLLVDIVSKNGCMLLDVSPAADGTIPDQARTMLLGMGAGSRSTAKQSTARGRGPSSAKVPPAAGGAASANAATRLSPPRTSASPPAARSCMPSPWIGPRTASC